MKAFTALVILALSAVAVYANNEAPVITSQGYHMRIGIPKATYLRKLEEEQNSPSRIVGGSVTDISNVPYQAGLVLQILWIFTSVCGGSLISTNRVVTAAHCINDGSISAQSITVVLGSNTLFSGGERIGTTDAVVHPNWTPAIAASDIALIRLPRNVAFSNVIAPISLPSGAETSLNFVGETALASGWGLTVDGGSISTSQLISSVSLEVITNAQCANTYGSIYVHDSNICTSGAGGKSTCSGDSGGPLAIDSNGRRILVGVTSFGHIEGCQVGHPPAFARITSFLSWILSL